jgi:hypothetical protein
MQGLSQQYEQQSSPLNDGAGKTHLFDLANNQFFVYLFIQLNFSFSSFYVLRCGSDIYHA